LGITIDQVREGILYLIALVLSITVHEYGHALVATKLGDHVPRSQGRLTLSPVAHVDPIGTLLFPLIMHFTGIPLLGWGRPVQTNPLNYTRRFTRSTGHMLVALAGPAMNLGMAALVSLLVVIAGQGGLMSREAAIGLIQHMIFLNLSLMFFNLLPIPPLDGGAVLAWLLPRSLQHVVDFLTRWGFLILLGLMMTPLLSFFMLPARLVTQVWGLTVLGASGL
jgi:Zn-dependent protease